LNSASSSSSVAAPSKEIIHNNKTNPEDLVIIAEKVHLTKSQYEVLNIICNIYQTSLSEYMQEALLEALKFDIEEGNFCDVLLEKITDNNEGHENNRGRNNSYFPIIGSVENDLNNSLQF
jgi:hypothetical protein